MKGNIIMILIEIGSKKNEYFFCITNKDDNEVKLLLSVIKQHKSIQILYTKLNPYTKYLILVNMEVTADFLLFEA